VVQIIIDPVAGAMADRDRKRAVEDEGDDDDDDDDDDFGPMPAGAPSSSSSSSSSSSAAAADAADAPPARKKAKKLPFERTFLENLPSSDTYEHSFMHRDVVTHVAVAKSTEFVVTGSADGHVKFWKKMPTTIEFVKHFQAHLGAITGLVVSPDDKRLVTTSVDNMIKVGLTLGDL